MNVALTTGLSLVLAPALLADTLQPACPLPFKAVSKMQPIDAKCGLSGNASGALGAQDQAKNNFCATGAPVTLQFADYPALQAAAEKLLGAAYKPPADRKGLRNIQTVRGTPVGEGTVVRIAAFVDRARYSDVEKGESVNCNLTGDANNDVHIPLVAKTGDDECTSVTAEISPHFRPAAWTPGHLNALGRAVRITGQLFFDASHKPCTKDKVEEPKRQAVWEIHPVYAVEVCTSAQGCDAATDSQWQPLDDYLAAPK